MGLVLAVDGGPPMTGVNASRQDAAVQAKLLQDGPVMAVEVSPLLWLWAEFHPCFYFHPMFWDRINQNTGIVSSFPFDRSSISQPAPIGDGLRASCCF